MRGGSLCSGGGGLDLGLERALPIEWAWHCEPDPYCARVLEAHWPGVPNLGDLFDVEWAEVEPVDLLAAGFPCPDYSLAGKRQGIEGDHGQVWFGVAAAVRALRPRYLVFENVTGIRTASGVRVDAGESALGVVLADLAALGYRWAYDCARAADLGAPHGRDRWFCVAVLSADAEGRVGADGPGGDGREPAVELGGSGAGGRDRGGDPAEGVRVVGRGPGGDRGDGAEVAGGGAAPADAVSDGVDPDGRVHGRGAGASRPGRSAASAVSAGPAVDESTDAVEDRADAAPDAERERRDRRGVGDEAGATGVGEDGGTVAPGSAAASSDAAGEGLPRAAGERVPRDEGRSPVGGGEDPRRPRLLPSSDADDPGRGEHGGPVAARAALGSAERGRGEAAPDAGRDGLVREPTLDGADEGLDLASGDVADGRALGVGGPDGTRAGGSAPADAGREPGQPGGGRRASGGPRPRRGTAERDGDRHDGPAEPRQALEGTGASADPAGIGRDGGPGGEVGGRERLEEAVGDEGVEAARDGGSSGDGASADADDGPGVGERAREESQPGVAWGIYESAVRRWESVLGRAAPPPTDERGRLNPRFAEWMMGWPYGWVEVEGVPRTAQLRIIGNGVVAQCSQEVGLWLAELVDAGILV